MSDWAEQELERERREKEASQWHTEKSVREARIKDQRGPELFEELTNYVAGQVAKYNEGKRTEVLTFTNGTGVMQQNLAPANGGFTVRPKDGLGYPLIVAYRPETHTVEWKCGTNRGHFKLRIRDDGDVYLETPNRSYVSIEDLGDQLLTTFRENVR